MLRLTAVLWWPLLFHSAWCGTSASAAGSSPALTVSFHALWHRAFPWTWHQKQRWQAACHQEPKDRIPWLREARKTESEANLGTKPPHRFLLCLGTKFLSCEGMSTHPFHPKETVLTGQNFCPVKTWVHTPLIPRKPRSQACQSFVLLLTACWYTNSSSTAEVPF